MSTSFNIVRLFTSINHYPLVWAQFLILLCLTWRSFSKSNPLLIYLSLEALTCIIKTGQPILVELRSGEFSHDLNHLNGHTEMVNFPFLIPGCDSDGPALFYLFLSSDPGISSAVAFPLLGNSDHVFVWSCFCLPLDWNN